jgi:hypothetical protein
MQSTTKVTHHKSNHAAQQSATKQKAAKEKIKTAVVINLEEKWLDKQNILERLHISDSTLLK